MLITGVRQRSGNYLLPIILVFLASSLHAQEFDLKKIEINSMASFRSVSVVDDSVAWIGGTRGTVGYTHNGGISWTFQQVGDFEKADFRSLYAFDRRRALIVNAGSPTTVLLTEDGGKNWRAVHTNTHADAFVDGMDFWDEKNGVIYGDPIEGAMLILRTRDGGLTWKEIPTRPHLESGEASFAASGTGIRCLNKSDLFICTGGKISRLWISSDAGKHWLSRPAPILQGESSTGIFSMTKSGERLIVVGGDYKHDSSAVKNNFYSDDNGKNWTAPVKSTNGYRECVEAIEERILLAAGPTGIDISRDLGLTWESFSNTKGLHVIRRARRGSLTIAAGANGQLYILRRK